MTTIRRTPASRLLALALLVLVVLQPVASAANPCMLRTLVAPDSCCCEARADDAEPAVVVASGTRACCATEDEDASAGAAERATGTSRAAPGSIATDGERARGCDCRVAAPEPATARLAPGAGAEPASGGVLAHWIADGAARSALVALPASLHGPPVAPDAAIASSLAASRGDRARWTASSTFGCARAPLSTAGARGLLAALATALL